MPKKPFEVPEGSVFAIPLFTSDLPPSTKFKKKDLEGDGKKFAFMRIIHNAQGSGFIFEVFNLIGTLSTPLEKVILTPRLFRPIAFSGLAIRQKRWILHGQHENYDKEKHSGFSKIELVFSPFDQPKLWRGGITNPCSPNDVNKYEHWTLHQSHRVEKRILELLQP